MKNILSVFVTCLGSVSKYCNFFMRLTVVFICSFDLFAAGVQPESSVVIVEESDGEAMFNVKNTEETALLLLSTLSNVKGDDAELLVVYPPVARIEPGESQAIRFFLTSKEPIQTERLKRVVFEGIPPKRKNTNSISFVLQHDIPVIIRPTGLAKERKPWERLQWTFKDGALEVTNPSSYVVRLVDYVNTLPGEKRWYLPDSFILPGQRIVLKSDEQGVFTKISHVRLFPATAWGYFVESYDAALSLE